MGEMTLEVGVFTVLKRISLGHGSWFISLTDGPVHNRISAKDTAASGGVRALGRTKPEEGENRRRIVSCPG